MLVLEVLFALLAVTSCSEASKVLSMRMGKIKRAALEKRQSAVNVPLGNVLELGLYYVNASVGSPGQTVQLQIDTGSSDVWMFSPSACPASDNSCFGGTFDPIQSNSYELIYQGGFSIQYVTAGSFVNGDYFADIFAIGGASVSNLTMALAQQDQAVPVGIMGIGFDTDESLVTNNDSSPYLNLIDVMVNQNLINSRAYSLYLDDQEASTGSIIFGGYDSDKFSGELLALPIQPDAQSGTITSFTVALTSLGWTDSTGTTTLTSNDYVVPVVLDSGTTNTILPDDLALTIISAVGAASITGEDNEYAIDCGLSTSSVTINYGFGGSGGPVIAVPFSELVGEPVLDNNNQPETMPDGNAACSFGIETAGGRPYLLGDTFLRSAYVVYDLDNLQCGIAPTVFNSTSSNIQEIGGNSAAIASTVVSGVTATQTASLAPGNGEVQATSSVVGASLASVAPTGTQKVIFNTGAASTTSSSSTSSTTAKSGASSIQPLQMGGRLLSGILMMVAVVTFLTLS